MADATPSGGQADESGLYRVFARPTWAALRASAPFPLTTSDLEPLQGIHDRVPLAEVEEVLLPLARLVGLHVTAARRLARVESDFLRERDTVPPFLIAVTGSVAVGKSTFARLFQAVLARGPDRAQVALVTTDGFLLSNRELEAKGLLDRKGFPESYDLRRMIATLAAIKAGAPEVEVPVYSHAAYDILPHRFETIRSPDILILEGLNLLQVRPEASVTASDFLDFSIYLDASEADIETWFVERLLVLQRTAFQDPASYFHKFSALSAPEAAAFAHEVWRTINGPNLRENIAPTRSRARVVLRKGSDHAIREIALRRA